MNTYLMMKKIIEAGGYDKEEVMEKLNVFRDGKRITKEQYKELVALLNA